MSNYNHIVLLGRLTADPELRYTSSGTAYCRFTLAVNRPQSKEARDRGDKPGVDFLDCVAWRGQAENLANYQKKGSLLLVEGRLQKRKYQNQEGENRYVTEVTTNSVTFMPKGNRGASGGDMGATEDDEVPF